MANVVRGAFKDPTTKANFVDRMMSRDFDGDLRSLAVGGNLQYERVRPHILRLKFGDSGQEFEMVIRKPRSEEALQKFRAKRGKTINASTKRPSRKRGEKVELKENEAPAEKKKTG